MKKSKSFKKWASVIAEKADGTPWLKNEIIYFRSALGSKGRRRDPEKDELIKLFFNSMPEGGYNLTMEQQDKGINYLLNKTFTTTDRLRKRNRFDALQINIIENYSHFKFTGLYGNGVRMLPIYKCISKFGDSFEYTGTIYENMAILRTNAKSEGAA